MVNSATNPLIIEINRPLKSRKVKLTALRHNFIFGLIIIFRRIVSCLYGSWTRFFFLKILSYFWSEAPICNFSKLLPTADTTTDTKLWNRTKIIICVKMVVSRAVKRVVKQWWTDYSFLRCAIKKSSSYSLSNEPSSCIVRFSRGGLKFFGLISRVNSRSDFDIPHGRTPTQNFLFTQKS